MNTRFAVCVPLCGGVITLAAQHGKSEQRWVKGSHLCFDGPIPRVVAVVLFALSCLVAPVTAADASRVALVSLCDPAKIATLKSDRAANPRVRKIAYWLEVARQQGRDPKAKMDAVMTQLGWGGTAKGELTAAATLLHGSRDPGHERRLKRWQRVPRGAPSGVNDSMLGLESDNVVVVLGNCS